MGPGGLLLVADEVAPRNRIARMLRALIRAPLGAIAWLVTQRTTHAVSGLADRVASAGIDVVSGRRSGLGDFAETVARRRADPAP